MWLSIAPSIKRGELQIAELFLNPKWSIAIGQQALSCRRRSIEHLMGKQLFNYDFRLLFLRTVSVESHSRGKLLTITVACVHPPEFFELLPKLCNTAPLHPRKWRRSQFNQVKVNFHHCNLTYEFSIAEIVHNLPGVDNSPGCMMLWLLWIGDAPRKIRALST